MLESVPRQPPPVDGGGQCVTTAVIHDLRERSHAGALKYGCVLRSRNGRDMLIDAYEEQLDHVLYLRGEIMDRGVTIRQPSRLRSHADAALHGLTLLAPWALTLLCVARRDFASACVCASVASMTLLVAVRGE